MIVGVGEWGFREMPMAEHFRIAADFGFRYLEVGIGGGQPGRLPEDPSAADVAAIETLRRSTGVQTPFCVLENDFTLADESAHRAMVQKVLRQMESAAALGCTHLRLFAGFTPAAEMDEPRWQRMLGAFGDCERRARELGLEIAIETHGAIRFLDDGAAVHTPTVSTDRDALARLLQQLPPRVGFNYDPGNLKAAHPDDPRLALDLLDARINYCHLKDWSRRGEGWVAGAPGDDDLDYGSLLARMSFDGVHLIEYEPLHDPLDGIRRSLRHLGRVVPELRFS